MSFKYDGLIKSLEICMRNEWGHTSASRSVMREIIWEATKALIDCREEMENAEHGKLPPARKAAFSEHGLAGSIRHPYGEGHRARPLDVEELEDEDSPKDYGLGSLLKRTGL